MSCDVDAVEGQVLDDAVRVAISGVAHRRGGARHRPALEAGRVEVAEDPDPSFDQRLDLEVLLPHRPVREVLGQAGQEQVGGLEEVPIRRDDKGLSASSVMPSSLLRASGDAEARPHGKRDQPVGTS